MDPETDNRTAGVEVPSSNSVTHPADSDRLGHMQSTRKRSQTADRAAAAPSRASTRNHRSPDRLGDWVPK